MLREIVHEKLQASQEDSASAAPFQLVDYLQLAALGRHSLLINVEDDGESGKLEVVDGEIWTVSYGSLRGREALAMLFKSPPRRLDIGELGKQPEERQLEAKTESLLLDLARAHDEETREIEVSFLEAAETDAGDDSEAGAVPLSGMLDEAANEACRNLLGMADGGRACLLFGVDPDRVIGGSTPRCSRIPRRLTL